jgi:hypothetical protein
MISDTIVSGASGASGLLVGGKFVGKAEADGITNGVKGLVSTNSRQQIEQKLSCSALTEILSRPSLTLKSEDDLLEFLMDESTDFASLVEFVNFVSVTADEMAKFSQFLSDHFEFMTVGLSERLPSRD